MYSIPKFQITNKILGLVEEVAHEIGVLSGAKLILPTIKLRKNNQIKTIQSSLAIEGNTLSIDQVTAIIDGKKIIAPEKDIIEVSNAIKLYTKFNELDPLSVEDFLKSHKLLMDRLIPDSGMWRKHKVAIFKGVRITHIAPAPTQIPKLMYNLFEFINSNNQISWLIYACVFHYELEFIHPFSDGNGRMGRLWQQLLLKQYNPIFEYISVEELIKANQSEYYEVLRQCDNLGESTLFIEFMLEQVLQALQCYINNTTSLVQTTESRLEFAKLQLKNTWFSRKEYIMIHKNISTSTASRDLSFGLQQAILASKGDKNQTYYKFNQ